MKAALLVPEGCATDIRLLYCAGLDGKPTMPTRMESGRRGAGVGDTSDGSSAREGSGGSLLIERVGESPEGVDGDDTGGGVGNGGLALTVPERVRARGDGAGVALGVGGCEGETGSDT